MVDHGLLDGMQRSPVSQILDGKDLRPVHLTHEQDAGVDGTLIEPAVAGSGQNDGAGAAVAFPATLFRAGGVGVEPQPVQQGGVGRETREIDPRAPEDEADMISFHGGLAGRFALLGPITSARCRQCPSHTSSCW